MRHDLIIDVGMHRGNDTEFYLLKGFRVAGIEANPVLAQLVERRLAEYLDNGRLRIYNLAIADRIGSITLWLNDTNDDWGTTNGDYARRNEAFGTTNRPIEVPCKRFDDILDECGVPYYLKIDIEGADVLCLQALQGRELPKYLSIEADMTSFDALFADISNLWNLGYRQFKILNQGLNRHLRCPNPPREGNYVDYRFDHENLCSGLFGEETPGKWVEADRLLTQAIKLNDDERNFGINGRYIHTLWGRAYAAGRWLMRRPICWYDIHARMGTESVRVPVSSTGTSQPAGASGSDSHEEVESAVRRA